MDEFLNTLFSKLTCCFDHHEHANITFVEQPPAFTPARIKIPSFDIRCPTEVQNVTFRFMAYEDTSYLEEIASRYRSKYDYFDHLDFSEIVSYCLDNKLSNSLKWFVEACRDRYPSFENTLIFNILKREERLSLAKEFNIDLDKNAWAFAKLNEELELPKFEDPPKEVEIPSEVRKRRVRKTRL
jgi:hypothetical protein